MSSEYIPQRDEAVEVEQGFGGGTTLVRSNHRHNYRCKFFCSSYLAYNNARWYATGYTPFKLERGQLPPDPIHMFAATIWKVCQPGFH